LPFAASSSALAAPTYAQLVGQKLMVAMSGTTPSSDLLGRVGRGEVGGVILFGSNITSAAALRALSATLQAAAANGGQPPLLIATDQEGGSIKRVPWAPPTLSPPQMGALGSTQTAFDQGKATGFDLRCGGINNDLAPVADVPSSTSSFMYQQGRTWSFDASLTATLSDSSQAESSRRSARAADPRRCFATHPPGAEGHGMGRERSSLRRRSPARCTAFRQVAGSRCKPRF